MAAATDQNGRVRSPRLGVALIAACAALLAGCTDPSPDLDGTGEDATSSAASESAEALPSEDESTAEPTEESTTEPAAPVFGPSADQPGGAASACVPALDTPLTFSTVLTAIDTITLDGLTLEPANAEAEIEILDAYVLPFSGGAGGLAVGDYPPSDPTSARDDVGEYLLEAGETIVVGVGVTAQTPASMRFVLTYHGGDGAERTLAASHEVTIADSCEAHIEPTDTPSPSGT